jgi:hypothetical protein
MISKKNYMYRLTFRFDAKGVINVDETDAEADSLTYEQPNGFPIMLHSCGGNLRESDEFQITQGGYAFPELAWKAAQELATALLLSAADLGIGVDVGTLDLGNYSAASAAPGTITFNKELFEKIEEKEKLQTVSQKRGITVVEQRGNDWGIMSIDMKGLLRDQPLKPLGLIYLLAKAEEQKISLSPRSALALELFHNSFFEVSMRANFLTLMQMLESLSEPRSRSAAVQQFVEQIQDNAKHTLKSTTNPDDRRALDGMISLLSSARFESITQAIERLAEECCPGQLFLEKSPAKFIKQCYGVRSELVHTGKTKLTPTEFVQVFYSLRSLCIQVIRSFTGYKSVPIPQEMLGQLSFLSKMTFSGSPVANFNRST